MPHRSGIVRDLGHARGVDRRRISRVGPIAGDVTAQAIGLDVHLFTHRPPDATDAVAEAYLRPMVEKAAFALSVNEAWMLIASVALIGMLLPFAGKPRPSADVS